MVRRCCVKSCGVSKGVIHLFPKNGLMRKIWQQTLKNEMKNNGNLQVENFGVCENHFLDSDYITVSSLKKKRSLLPSAVPQTPRSENQMIVPNLVTHESTDDSPETSFNQIVPELEPLLDPNEEIDSVTIMQRTRQLEKEMRDLKILVSKKNKILIKKDSIIQELRETVKSLRRQTEKSNKIEENYCKLQNLLTTIFSPKQVQKLMEPERRVCWTESDISKAVALDSVSSKCYNYLRDTLRHPLPSKSTLKHWMSKISLRPGILEPVLSLMSAQFQDSSLMGRSCILAIDDMKIDEKYCYDERDDRIYGGSGQLSATFIRGLFSSWRQMVQYGFDERIDRAKLFEIITRVHESGADVSGIVCDLGPKNQGLWRDLDICRIKDGTLGTTRFENPVTGESVWVFPDFPHILKLLRNHLIDDGLTLPDGTRVGKSLIEDLLTLQKSELKLTFKLSHKHINVRGKQRMKVRPACELFSAKVAGAIRFAFPKRKSEAEFFFLINNFTDLMNTRSKTPNSYNVIFKSTFGTHYSEQCKFLAKLYEYFSKIRVGHRKLGSYPPFQKGFLVAIRSLIGLFENMMRRTSCKYIMTSHLNQDYVENSFAILRGLGGLNMNPTAVEVVNRIRKLMVGVNLLKPKGSNAESMESEDFMSANFFSILQRPSLPTASQKKINYRFPIVTEEMEDDIISIFPEVKIEEVHADNLSIYDKCEEGGREYVAGFIASKLCEKHPELVKMPCEYTAENSFWVRLLSDGGLTEPSVVWMSYFKKFEEYFEVFHLFGKICTEPDVVKRMVLFLTTNYHNIPHEIIQFYAKTRTMIRISNLNKQVEDKRFICQEQQRNLNVRTETLLESYGENINIRDAEGENQLEELLNLLM